MRYIVVLEKKERGQVVIIKEIIDAPSVIEAEKEALRLHKNVAVLYVDKVDFFD